MNILVLGSGGAAGKALTKCINKKYNVIGTDSDKWNLNFSPAKKTYLIPKYDNINYLENIKNIIKKHKPEVMFVQNDTEVEILSKYIPELKVNTFLPNSVVVNKCQDKILCHKILGELSPKKAKHFPMWMRAYKGAGGKGSIVINNIIEMIAWKMLNPEIKKWQYSEYLNGNINIGCDVFVFNGKIISYFMKERIRYLPGKSMSGITGASDIAKIINNPLILTMCQEAINKLDAIYGLFGIDFKSDKNGNLYITEINPGRFLTGSIIGFNLTGFNFPDALIKFTQTHDINIFKKLEKNRKIGALTLRQIDASPVMIYE